MNTLLSEHFMFASGIENSYPTILLPNGSSKRVDEMEKPDITSNGKRISGY